jgi:sulfoxide reductase catalytic subunit YedY
MIIKRKKEIPSSDITSEKDYKPRREFLRTVGMVSAGIASTVVLPQRVVTGSAEDPQWRSSNPSRFNTTDELNSWKDITSYNNYYEFGTDKSDPVQYSATLRTSPWTVTVDGLVKKPTIYHLEDLVKGRTMEDRIYRHRCVEGWSMVIPWLGFPLGDLIKKIDPLPRAKYVAFTTLLAPDQMPGQRSSVLRWPYTEGLRIDEAMHPLTILSVGLYGKPLPNQNGAPLRLVVPWKYGFKSIKSIVRISFVEEQPPTSWNSSSPNEYGFYSNVNPAVDHPRWSQARERRIGDFFKRNTLLFNGYGDQVASLYSGLDLHKHF